MKKVLGISVLGLGLVLGNAEGAVSAKNIFPIKCTERRLHFSSDEILGLPNSSAWVWGGGAGPWSETANNARTYVPEFLAKARAAKAAKMEVFAYLEGPCGDTAGNDDGERAACAKKHTKFIERISQKRSSPYRFLLEGLDGKGVNVKNPRTRWYPYTFAQLMESGAHGVDFCEVDNLENNVKINLSKFLEKYKSLFDAGRIHCRLVLKNISPAVLDTVVENYSGKANFIAPFHIFEADDLWRKDRNEFHRVHSKLNTRMIALKGSGAVTLMSKRTTAYASRNFTQGKFMTCPHRR